jgi:hypothetical protein
MRSYALSKGGGSDLQWLQLEDVGGLVRGQSRHWRPLNT